MIRAKLECLKLEALAPVCLTLVLFNGPSFPPCLFLVVFTLINLLYSANWWCTTYEQLTKEPEIYFPNDALTIIPQKVKARAIEKYTQLHNEANHEMMFEKSLSYPSQAANSRLIQ